MDFRLSQWACVVGLRNCFTMWTFEFASGNGSLNSEMWHQYCLSVVTTIYGFMKKLLVYIDSVTFDLTSFIYSFKWQNFTSHNCSIRWYPCSYSNKVQFGKNLDFVICTFSAAVWSEFQLVYEGIKCIYVKLLVLLSPV